MPMGLEAVRPNIAFHRIGRHLDKLRASVDGFKELASIAVRCLA